MEAPALSFPEVLTEPTAIEPAPDPPAFPRSTMPALPRSSTTGSERGDAREACAKTPATPPSWTAELLDPRADLPLAREATRYATGLGLAAIYGAAMGARAGGSALLVHAVGVPAALLAAFGLGTPALYVALALFDAPVEPPAAAAAAARGVATTGLVLAGFAPAAALFVVSSEHAGAAALAAGTGLAAGLMLGLARLLRELAPALSRAPLATRGASGAAFVGFCVFAVAVAARVAAALLPVLGGAR
jgi:hypothetical protein